jgi:hypothetical protein
VSIAEKIDAQVDKGKVQPYWRQFFKLRSIQWNIGNVMIALVNLFVTLAAIQDLRLWFTHALFTTAAIICCLGSMYGALTRQKGLKSEDDLDS